MSDVRTRLNADGIDYDKVIYFKFLWSLEYQGGRKMLDFGTKAGPITDRYECSVCGKDMRLIPRDDIGDGFNWTCRSRCEGTERTCKRSVRKGSRFSLFLINMNTAMQLAYMWAKNCNNAWMMDITKCSIATLRF